MTNLENRLIQLERVMQLMSAQISLLQDQVAKLNQDAATGQGSPAGGGSVGVYTIPGVVIGAGGNVTGQTVSVLIAGANVTVTTTGKVYNQMGVATVTGKLIICGQNPDGTFTAITQSC